MNYALERNRYREGLYSKQQAFESWRQLIEVILASCPPELLNREIKQTMIFDLMRDLLAKVGETELYYIQNYYHLQIFYISLKKLIKNLYKKI